MSPGDRDAGPACGSDTGAFERQWLKRSHLVERERFEVTVELERGKSLGTQAAISEELRPGLTQSLILKCSRLPLEPVVVGQRSFYLLSAASTLSCSRSSVAEQARESSNWNNG